MQSFLVVSRLHQQFAFLLGAERNNLKLNVALVWVHLSVAHHHLEILAQHIIKLLVLLDEAESLVVDNTVGDRLRVQEPPVNEEVEEQGQGHATHLVLPHVDKLAELLFALADHVMVDFVLSFVFVSFDLLFGDLQGGLDLGDAGLQALVSVGAVDGVVDLDLAFGFRLGQNKDLG